MNFNWIMQTVNIVFPHVEKKIWQIFNTNNLLFSKHSDAALLCTVTMVPFVMLCTSGKGTPICSPHFRAVTYLEAGPLTSRRHYSLFGFSFREGAKM